MSPTEGASMPTGGHREENAEGSKRLLVCTPFPPRLDARHGGRATAQLLARLVERHEVALLCLRSENDNPTDELFVARCVHIEEVPLRRSAWARFAWSQRVRWAVGLIRGRPPWVLDLHSKAYESRLRELVREWQPDVVEVHVAAMAQYVSSLENFPGSKILVDYDPPSAWAEELMTEVRGPRRLGRRLEVATWRRYERATRKQFDAIVVFAERDVAAVSATSERVPVIRIPLAFDIPEIPLDPVGAAPPTVVFVGGFGHPPNVDAAHWLAERIFPRVLERVPNARLDLVGDRPGKDIRRLASGAVTVHGSVPDVTPYLDRAAVVVAPLRLGGSMRGKVLEALVAGKALVATPRAAEGLGAVPGEHYVLAASEEEIVKALVELLVDPDRRRKLATSARAWARANLAWDGSAAAFERLYESFVRGERDVQAARTPQTGLGPPTESKP